MEEKIQKAAFSLPLPDEYSYEFYAYTTRVYNSR
jgi:hypothetical protein